MCVFSKKYDVIKITPGSIVYKGKRFKLEILRNSKHMIIYDTTDDRLKFHTIRIPVFLDVLEVIKDNDHPITGYKADSFSTDFVSYGFYIISYFPRGDLLVIHPVGYNLSLGLPVKRAIKVNHIYFIKNYNINPPGNIKIYPIEMDRVLEIIQNLQSDV